MIVGVVATLVSLYYYLARRARDVHAPERGAAAGARPAGGSPPREPLLHVAVGLALAVSVGSLFAVGPLIDLAKHAVGSLPF